jgi:hypothetical protein
VEFPIYVFDPAKHSDSGKGQRGLEQGNGPKPSTDNRQSGDQLVDNGSNHA